MTNVITLDSIREAAEKKYGHTDIDIPGYGTARLLNAMQLSSEKRKALTDSAKSEEGVEEDDLAGFHRVIRTVARSQSDADAIINAVGDNIAVMSEIFDRYNKGTELGEA